MVISDETFRRALVIKRKQLKNTFLLTFCFWNGAQVGIPIRKKRGKAIQKIPTTQIEQTLETHTENVKTYFSETASLVIITLWKKEEQATRTMKRRCKKCANLAELEGMLQDE